MKTQKKAFTLVEVVLVMGIMGVFLFVMKPFFQNTKKDYLYIESCINKVYGDMNNFMYGASTSKGIGTGTNRVFPDQYTIKIKNSNYISLEYKQPDGQIKTFLTEGLTGLQGYYCKSNAYTSQFSGDFFELTVNKNDSITNGNTAGYVLTGTKNAFTGSTTIQLCYSATKCKDVGKIDIDVRTQMLKKRKCMILNDANGTCTTRDQ